MKIALGTNLFGQYHRQNLFLENLKLIHRKYPNIDFYNLSFKHDAPAAAPDFLIQKNELVRSSRDICKESGQKLPFVNDMFDLLSQTDCDYFIFANSDVLVPGSLMERILGTDKDAVCVSRTEIKEIKGITDKMVPIRIEVAGFDFYAVRNAWWKKHMRLFPDYFFARPRWDNHFTTVMMKYGDSEIRNELGDLYHIFHGYGSHSNDNEMRHNDALFYQKYKGISDLWGRYLEYITQRQPPRRYIQPLPDEKETTRRIFGESTG